MQRRSGSLWESFGSLVELLNGDYREGGVADCYPVYSPGGGQSREPGDWAIYELGYPDFLTTWIGCHRTAHGVCGLSGCFLRHGERRSPNRLLRSFLATCAVRTLGVVGDFRVLLDQFLQLVFKL